MGTLLYFAYFNGMPEKKVMFTFSLMAVYVHQKGCRPKIRPHWTRLVRKASKKEIHRPIIYTYNIQHIGSYSQQLGWNEHVARLEQTCLQYYQRQVLPN